MGSWCVEIRCSRELTAFILAIITGNCNLFCFRAFNFFILIRIYCIVDQTALCLLTAIAAPWYLIIISDVPPDILDNHAVTLRYCINFAYSSFPFFFNIFIFNHYSILVEGRNVFGR